MQKRKDIIPQDFEAVAMKLASPERVSEWSYGEITKPETINYRTQRPEKNGLFDERVFGPEKDYECYCGKYRGIRFRGIVCEKCGVEITRAIVRRERMGHIDLATPVSHIWFLRGIPSRIALMLGLSAAEVEKVVYFAGYIVTHVDENERTRLLKELEQEFQTKTKSAATAEVKTELKEKAQKAKKEIESVGQGVVLDEAAYHLFAVKYGAMFRAAIGAEALYNILKNIDIEKFIERVRGEYEKSGAADRDKLRKRLALAEALQRAGVRPEWMFMTRLPVVPPALRPMVALEGGRHASSDLNDLYRRVINRNNRLKRLLAIHAPEVILRNEKEFCRKPSTRSSTTPCAAAQVCSASSEAVVARSNHSPIISKANTATSAKISWVNASTTRAARSSWSAPTSRSTNADCRSTWYSNSSARSSFRGFSRESSRTTSAARGDLSKTRLPKCGPFLKRR